MLFIPKVSSFHAPITSLSACIVFSKFRNTTFDFLSRAVRFIESNNEWFLNVFSLIDNAKIIIQVYFSNGIILPHSVQIIFILLIHHSIASYLCLKDSSSLKDAFQLKIAVHHFICFDDYSYLITKFSHCWKIRHDFGRSSAYSCCLGDLTKLEAVLCLFFDVP